MNRSGIILMANLVMVIMVCAAVARGAEADKEGVTPGRWTMDFDAARKLAVEKDLPILLNFSGSDWCGWCKLMEKNVFSKDAWSDYAKDNIIMVLLDFPKNKSIVPEKYKGRNAELKAAFGVRGFPALIVLDANGKDELGRLAAGRDKTPESFIGELTPLLRYRRVTVEQYKKTLKPEAAEAYQQIIDKVTQCDTDMARLKEEARQALEKANQLEKDKQALKDEARKFRVTQLGGDARAKYETLKADLAAAEQAFKAWIATKPPRNTQSDAVSKELQGRVQELAARLAAY